VIAAKSDYPTGMTEVTFDTDLVTQDQLIAAIESAGYGAEAE
jgi:copper chaperone CopZ